MADSRMMMNLKGIGGSLIPRYFFQRKLEGILKEISLLPEEELEKIYDRVNYYNKFTTPLEIEGSPNLEKIGKLPFKKTSLAFDGYRISKYFPDDLKWIKKYGDINWVLDEPSICKDRPIMEGEGNKNNVLLKLDQNRHFIFLEDQKRFEDKTPKAIFRGACYQPLRKRFMEKHFDSVICDVGDTARGESPWKRPPVSKHIQIENRFVVSLEGNTFASNLIWALSSNSLVIAPQMTCETWLMEGRLKANEHFALLKDDFSNLNELIDFYNCYPNRVQEIIDSAHSYLEEFKNDKREFLIGILVLAKYFYLSGQLELPNEISSLFVRG